VGCCGIKPEHSPQLHQTEDGPGLLALKHALSARMSCAVHRWIRGLLAACESLCEMHDTQLLLNLSLPNAEQTNSFVVGLPFSKLVASISCGIQ
jgi:hypothetical protein